jgi:predicted transcriptional regulator
MPAIQKSADLRNNLSIETYEELAGRNVLYRLIQEGIDDIENGKTFTEDEVLENMENALGK